jgi:hypothetical protein
MTAQATADRKRPAQAATSQTAGPAIGRAAARKTKRSFTLSPESIAYLVATRERSGAASDSEALDLLLRESRIEAKRRELDDTYKHYYDNASEEELAEQLEWATATSTNIFIDVPE